MALSAFVYVLDPDGTLNDQAVTGAGFVPSALLNASGRTGTVDTWATNIWFALGAAAAVANQAGAGFTVEDAVATMDTYSYWNDAAVDYRLSLTGTIAADHALKSFDADGYTLDAVSSGTTRPIAILALGGTDITNKAVIYGAPNSSTGNLAYTGVGFSPDLVIAIATDAVTKGSVANGSAIAYSAFDKYGNQWAVSWSSHDNQADSVAKSRQSTSHAVLLLTPTGAVDYSAAWVSMDADGFTLNYDDAGGATQDIIFFCIKGPSVKVGSFTKTTSAATVTQTVTGVGHTPKALVLAGFAQAASGSVVDDITGWVGYSDGTNDGGIFIAEDNAAATSVADSYTSSLAAYVKGAVGGGSQPVVGAVTAFRSDEFDIQFTANDAVADQILYISLGDAPAAPGSYTPRLALLGVG